LSRISLVCALTLLVAAIASAEEPALYTLRATVLPLEVVISVAEGWKWNQEFPAKLVVEEQLGVSLPRISFNREDASVSDGGRTARFALGPSVKVEKGARISGKLTFSICNDKSCKFFRNVPWTAASP